MKTQLFALLGTALMSTSIAGNAAAQDTNRFYGNVGYSALDTELADLDAANFRLGWNVTPYIALEGEALVGLGDETVNLFGTPVDVKLEHSFGAFAKAHYPVTEKFDVFARAGAVTAEIEADAAGYTDDGSDDAFAYGFGAEYDFTPVHGIRGDYTRYDFDDDAETDSFAVSYVMNF